MIGWVWSHSHCVATISDSMYLMLRTLSQRSKRSKKTQPAFYISYCKTLVNCYVLCSSVFVLLEYIELRKVFTALQIVIDRDGHFTNRRR